MLHSAQTPVHAWRDDHWIPTGSVVNGFSVSAACHPASDVGGDFYAVLYADDERLGVLFGDACGKGARAARIAALVRRQLPDRCVLFRNRPRCSTSSTRGSTASWPTIHS